MKVFKGIKFYLGAGLLIALVALIWSLPMDLNAAGVSGDALPDSANDKAKTKAPDVKHPMAGIIGKGGHGEAKRQKIQDYLNGKYKGREKGPLFGARADYRFEDNSIEKIRIDGDFTPPGYVKRADVDEDIRARSRAFLEEEKELLGLIDLEKELKGGAKVVVEHIPGTRVLKQIRYYMEVEGFWISGSTFVFTFTEAGEPVSMSAKPKFVSPEMRAAAKRFRTEGITAADIKKAVRADLVKKGLPQANLDRLGFGPEDEFFIVEEEPYVIYLMRFSYPDYGDDGGNWVYRFNAITGEIVEREYTSDDNVNY